MNNEKQFPGTAVLLTTFLVTLLTVISFTLLAQHDGKGGGKGGATPEERAKRLTERMKEELKLTPDQYNAYLKQVEEMKARRREMKH